MANEPRFEVYPQTTEAWGAAPAEPTGEFGWRFRAANGEITAVGGEGFTREADAMRACIQFGRDVGLPVGEKGIVTMPPILRADD